MAALIATIPQAHLSSAGVGNSGEHGGDIAALGLFQDNMGIGVFS